MGFMFWFWVAVCVISMAIEIITPSLTSIWFFVGGLLTLFLSCFDAIDWYWQVLAFMALSTVCLIAVRPLTKKILLKPQTETDAESFTNKEARMVTEATFDCLGTVVINGVTWSVRSKNGEDIAAGEIVRIVAMDGNKLIVEKI